MIIHDTAPLKSMNSDLYIMDIRNYTWHSSFDPTSATTQTQPSNNRPTTVNNPQSDSSNLATMKMVIGITSGVGTAILMITGIFGYKWYRNRQNRSRNDILKIPGNY